MAHFTVSSDGRIHREKTKKEKEQQAAKAKKEAATQLKQSRSNYQNYVSGERNRIISNQNRQQFDRGASLADRLAPIDQLRQKQQERRNKQQEQNNYNKYVTDRLKQDQNRIKYGPDELPRNNQIQNRQNDLEQRASQNAAALKQASQTDTAKELKKDVRIKQNEYNIANYLENQAKVDQEKTTNFDRLVNPIVSGLGELTDFSRLTGTQDVYDYETGKKTFLPNRREIKQQKVRRDSKGAWGYYNDLSYNFSKALGAKVLDTVTFGGGTALYYGNIIDDGVQEARQLGYSKNESLAYGTTVGIIAGTLDKTLDSFGGLAGKQLFGLKVPTLTEGVDKMFTKVLGNKTASTLFSNITREAASEFIEEFADNTAKYAINADKSDYDSFMDMIAKTLPDAFYSAVVGAGSGAVGRFAERNTVDMQERLKALDDYKATLEGIQPQSIPEAQYKEDQLSQVDNQLSELNSKYESGDVKRKKTNTQMEEEAIKALEEQKNKNKTAPNTTEQVAVENKEEVEKTEPEQEIKTKENIKSEEKKDDSISTKKEQQFEEIQKTNKMTDDQHVGIRKSSDIKTAEEAFKTTVDDDEDYLYPDFTKEEGEKALKNGKLTVYSSKPIEQGGFVSPSKQMAQDYAGNGEVYSQEVNINDVAWIDSNEGQLAKISTETTQETDKTNYNIPETKEADKIVAKITEDSTPEQKEKVEQVLTNNPPKNKTVTKFDDGTTVITPSEKTREGGVESASKYLNDSVSQQQAKDVEIENKKRRKSYDNLEKQYASQENTEMVEYIKQIKENDLYTVEHSSYEIFKEQVKLLEDPEDYYKKYTEKIEKIDSKNVDEIKKLQYEQIAMLRYFGDMKSPGYNPTLANDISVAFAQEGTDIAQAMATRKQMYDSSPQQIAMRTQQTLNSMFREEAKNHEGDVDWLNKNDPLKNPDSPYKMTETQFATVNYYANKLDSIEDKTSVEYLNTYGQLHNYIQSLFADNKITGKLKSLTITNVLASTRIWAQNIIGNFVNLAQFNGIDKLVATSVDKVISKKTDMRSVGMSFEGDIEFIKGFKQGITDSWSEFTNDITLSKFSSKFTDSNTTNIRDLGKKDFGKTFNDESPVGHALNRYQDFVNFALNLGDRPFAEGYYAQSIRNQRMLNAQIDAQASGKNTVYYASLNSDTNKYEVRYFDGDGKKINTFMTEDQYKNFSKTAVEEELTEQMCKIAEKEALENTYQNDNKITKAALKVKDGLNDIFHIGDYGFGDMVLKFTRTSSNFGKMLYEHSPLATKQLVKDVRALNRNIKAGTATVELQHKVSREAGKLFGGAITMGIVGALDWAGIIKIEGDHDDKKGDKFKESAMGSQEFSVKLPGGNYNYKISNDSTIGSLARLGKTAEELAKDGNDILEILSNMTAPFTNELIDVSFMSSILDLNNSYSDPFDNLAKKVAAQPSNLIPSMVKDVSFAIDNYTQRNTYDENLSQYMINQIVNKTPFRGMDFDKNTPIGHIKGLSGKTTAWGEVKTVGGDFLSSVWNTWLTGDTLSKIKNDKISNEIMDVYLNTNNTDAIPSLTNTKKFSYNKKEFDLSEKEQNKYMTTYGKTSYKAVRDLMKTNQYKNATDEQKVKLLDKAYDYAREKAIQTYLEKQGIPYNNYKQKDGKYTQYKKPVFEEIIENDISIEEATYKRNYNNSYKLKTAITNFDNYQEIAKNIKDIKKAYKGQPYKLRRYAVQTYINELEGLDSVQKAMLAKKEHSKSDYASYDDKILSYIKSLDLTDDEYQYMYKNLGLGGYWSMYYVDKTKPKKTKRTRRKRKR